MTHSEIVSFLWGVADLIRDTFKRGKYQDVILPLTVLRRLDKFMRHLVQTVRNGLGDRASTCIDPAIQIVQGRSVRLVSCQRSPEPVFLKWKSMEASPEGDFYVRSGPGRVRLAPNSAREYISTRFSLGG